MSIEDPKKPSGEQVPQPEQAPAAPLTPEALEPVSAPLTPENQEQIAEVKASLEETAAEAVSANNEPEEAQAASRPTLSREEVIQVIQEHQKKTGATKSFSKPAAGILTATGAFLAFFGALFASAFEKLGEFMGMKSGGATKSAAKPAGGGGHH